MNVSNMRHLQQPLINLATRAIRDYFKPVTEPLIHIPSTYKFWKFITLWKGKLTFVV